MLICTVILIALAIGAYFFKLHIPYCPNFFTVEFSIIPELIASIAYGPIFGIIVCLIKVIVHIICQPSFLITDVSNFVLDSAFTFAVGLFYMRVMYSENTKQKLRIKGVVIMEGAVLSGIAVLIPQFLLTRFVSFPLLEKDFGLGSVKNALILEQYQISMRFIKIHAPELISRVLPDINDITMGILVYNLPITFAKLMFCSVICALAYAFISPFLHYRR